MKKRSDAQINRAASEFWDRIWYDRKLVMFHNVKEGKETITPDVKKKVLAAMKKVEEKYGGRGKMINYYKDDFEWGMLCGKLSALNWVMGDEWDMLDT